MSRFLTALSVTPLADGQQWRLNEDLQYRSTLLLDATPHDGDVIRVPKGFITDFASVPAMLRGVLPPWNVWGCAAVLHDHLYWTQYLDRDIADSVLLEAMRVLGVDDAIAALIHTGVRVGGQASWDNNAELKASGYTRLAPLADQPPYASPI